MHFKRRSTLFQVFALCLSVILCIRTLVVSFKLSIWLILLPVVLIQYASMKLFETIKDKGNKTILYYGGYIVLIGGIISWLNGMIGSQSAYLEWVKLMEVSVPKDIPYLISSVIGIAVGCISFVYYFTIVHFRPMILILVGCIPIAASIRVGANTVGVTFLLFIICFLALYMIDGITNTQQDTSVGVTYSNKQLGIFLVGYIGLTVLIFSIVPKPDLNITNPLTKVLEQVVPKQLNEYNTSTLPSNLSARNRPEALSETLLFEVTGKPPAYLKTRGWDGYRENSWYIEREDFTMGYRLPFPEYKMRLYNKAHELLKLVEVLEQEGLLKLYPELSGLLQYQTSPITNELMQVIPQNFPSRMYLNPSGMIQVVGESYVYLDSGGTAFHDDKNKPHPTDPYTIQYIDNTLEVGSREMRLVQSLDTDTYQVLLQQLKASTQEHSVVIGDGGDDLLGAYDLLENCEVEQAEAIKYCTTVPPTITEKTYELARKITDGYTTTYDQVKAIENYFYTSGYQYNLKDSPIPEDVESVEYFLFESKKGGCVQFASAMTILCRTLGIPAKLTEGYVCEEYDATRGKYMIRAKHAHAFPEVYIPAYGWMIFEPTVSNREETVVTQTMVTYLTEMGGLLESQSFSNNVMLLIMVGAVIGVSIVSSIFMYERIWCITIPYREAKRALEMIYIRLVKVMKKKGYGIEDYYTPRIVAKELEKEGVDVTWLIELYNYSHYGGYTPTREEIQKALKKYKATCK